MSACSTTDSGSACGAVPDFTGDYKEFDYYLSYTVAGFSVALWDIYKLFARAALQQDIFNYNKYSTTHFLDLSVGYNFDTLFEWCRCVCTGRRSLPAAT